MLALDEDSSLERIEPRLLKEKADRTAVSAHLVDLRRLLTTEEDRLDSIQSEINAARKKLGQVTADLNMAAPDGRSEVWIEAMLWRRQAESRALSGEISMLGQELLSQPARVELIRANGDVRNPLS